MSDLRDKVKELADIAGLVPEHLQVTCFEVLLRDYLVSQAAGLSSGQKPGSEQATPTPAAIASSATTVEEAAKAQADVTLADIHVKARKFMEKYSVSIGEINNLFYKEGTTVMPLYEDLKTTRMSEAQIRVTLLHALHNALSDGDFDAQVDSVREECRDRKALDATNFAATYKNNGSLFDFDKYDKDTKALRLSEDGKKELAQLIKELQ